MLTLRNTTDNARDVNLDLQLRSELMAAYPWTESKPQNAEQFNRDDQASYDAASNTLTFREPGKEWYALVSTSDDNVRGAVGQQFWGPVPAGGRAAYREFGEGAGGQLRSQLRMAGGAEQTIWYAVAGSHTARAEAQQALDDALRSPLSQLRQKIGEREALLAQTKVTLPDTRLQAAFDWGKLNMADLRIAVTDLQIRDVDTGNAYSETITTIPTLRGIGAGYPDYPWFFGTDGAYTAYPLVVSGQWETAIAHLRAIRDVSRAVNGDTGKVVHEVVTDGSVFFGANNDEGNSNETAQFATAVALIWRWSGDDAFRDEMYEFVKDGVTYLTDDLDTDQDSFPEGLGMVERAGMGAEKLDVTAYTWQALQALEALAESKNDSATAEQARQKAAAIEVAFDDAWWDESQRLYADSLCNAPAEETPPDATNVCTQAGQQLQQRHWINATPLETQLAPRDRALRVLQRLHTSDFTGDTGLFHTGRGGGPSGAGELKVWTLPNSVMAVAEANYSQLGRSLKYMHAIADQIDLEMPGALPEIGPSPEYDPFADFRERAMVMQAWSSYGVQWPVINHFLGIQPNIPAGTLSVVPDLPPSWPGVAVEALRLGEGTLAVDVRMRGKAYTVEVVAPAGLELTLGQVLPVDAQVQAVTLDGATAAFTIVETARGREVRVATNSDAPRTLVITLR